ncbi:DNA-directed RNA polymerase subunit beta [Shimazuella sp. AN120528]|uniref:DNA-directed RNA polymerase subunit beta n=1 Tax=Shimazuella soli TaxID=1892854 RepID=UPI001F0F27A7|nr:DNA-directed RNA polymerase subunit beta [Shimazuella soli]MCH5585269.1 DNA-directed RNA polymerase subunit beta [Shimazuella soli]
MSQLEDKKDTKNDKVKVEQDDNRLPVGELKWSKEQQEGQVEEEQKESKEKVIAEKEQEKKQEKKQESTEKDSVQSEVSATLLEVEKEQEADVSSQEEKEEKKQDPLAGIEDTLTPIDFKTYEFDAEQLKAIEQELNSLNPQKLEEELNTIHHQPPLKDHVEYEEDEEEYTTDSRWVKRSIWILGIPALLVIVLFVSLIIGHTVVGGQPVSDIFDMNMWMHVYNLIYG